uniref:ABC transporter permease n=1 Tax=Pararhizobium sp. IMCC3301 TaxID=3067904 RepID=UPI002741BDA4|nr:ABC transporter permease [Pararhizobium sp. IMCC3301]
MLLRAIAGLIATLAVWLAVVRVFEIPSFLLPSPVAVWESMVFLARFGKLFDHTAVTVSEIVYGFVAGVVIGITTGIVFARSEPVERLATPLVLLLQTAPKIAIAPLLLLWLGIGPAPKIVLIAIVTFFPVMAGMRSGLKYGETAYKDLAKVLKLSAWQRFVHLDLPNSIPSVLAGMKVATTLAMTAAVIGELMGASEGLGYLLSSGQENSDSASVIGVVLLLSLLGWLSYQIVEKIEQSANHRFRT